MIKQKCSNCRKDSEYTKEEWEGRENMRCKQCNSWLSPASSWWLGPDESNDLRRMNNNPQL